MADEYPCQHGCLLCFISRETYDCQRCCGYWLCTEHYEAYFGQSIDGCDANDDDADDDVPDDEEGEEESDLEYDPRFPEDGTEYIYRDPEPADDDGDDADPDDEYIDTKPTGCGSEPEAEAMPEASCSEPEHECDAHQDDEEFHDHEEDGEDHEDHSAKRRRM